MTIGILGDIFKDRYWVGSSNRLSAETLIPVVNIDMEFDLPGGAGNVAENVRGLGVKAVVIPNEPKNVPIKNRLIVNDQQLARFDENDWCEPVGLSDLYPLIDCQGLIVSDYGKGSISQEGVIHCLKQINIPVFVDTKNDPSCWIGSETILFPNLQEYRKYQDKYEWFPRLILKQGEQGMSLVEFGKVVMSRPSTARFVRSCNGCGDSAVAAFAVAYLTGANLDYCLRFANSAAGVACENPYTTVVSLEEVNERMNN
jgi:bifunctional ADP-heptose synthase (sugar kinase/adenylyltransferase)